MSVLVIEGQSGPGDTLEAAVVRSLEAAERGRMMDVDHAQLLISAELNLAPPEIRVRIASVLQAMEDQRWLQERLQLAYRNR
jgi:hypothetical protein